MFPPIHMDEERDEHGEITKHGVDYYLKPMNCPMHILIYKERARSYRDLPMRLAENGTVYRNELSGALHGLTRVRGFTQDDSHLFVTPEQLEERDDQRPRVRHLDAARLRPRATSSSSCRCATTRRTSGSAPTSSGTYVDGRAAQRRAGERAEARPRCPARPRSTARRSTSRRKDAIGRTWQLSTVQVDSNLPERFELEYTDRDGQKKRPIMIHRALFGSIERFFAILLEHYAGAFPVWLSPVQVVGIPVAEEYARLPRRGHRAAARREGVRAELDAQRRPHAEEDPHPHHAEGAAPADRRRAGPRRRHRQLPLPRRHAGERRADRRRGAPHPRGDRARDALVDTAEDLFA